MICVLEGLTLTAGVQNFTIGTATAEAIITVIQVRNYGGSDQSSRG